MFEEIYQLFLADDDPCSTSNDWRRLFFHPWASETDPYGYALVDNGSVVGILGMAVSERLINDEWIRFCNLHSWRVMEAYRGRSLALLRPAIALRDHVLTDFTPTARVAAISKRLGFTEIDARVKILLPMYHRYGRKTASEYVESEAIASVLSPGDLRLYRDHRHLDCGHLVFQNKGRYCYLIFSRVVRHQLPYCYLHYISNRDLFERYNSRLRQELSRRASARYVAVDARRVAGLRLPLGFTFPINSGETKKIAGMISECESFNVILVEGASDPMIPKIKIGNGKERTNTIMQYQNDFGRVIEIIKKEIDKKKRKEKIKIEVNGKEIALSEFPADIITSSLVGMLSSLKGVDTINEASIHLKISS